MTRKTADPNTGSALPEGASGPTLRQRAEAKFKANETSAQAALSPEETLSVLHELQVHQIELELQNEELRRTQADLEASQARYFDLYDLAPVGYFTVSETGLLLEANLTAAALLGVTRNALAKQPLTRFILPKDQDIYYLHRKQLFETGAPQACELRLQRSNSTHFWARLEMTVAADAADATGAFGAQGAGGARACRVTLSDITTLKQAEDARLKTLQQTHAILESISDAFFSLDLQLRVTYFNAAAEQALGRQRGDILGRPLFEAFPEARGSVFDEHYTRALREQTPLHFETYFGLPPYANWYEVRVYPYAGGLSVYFQVITERKQAEEALRESAAQYRLAESELKAAQTVARLGNWKWNIPKGEVTWSDEMYRIFGIDRTSYTGRLGDVIAQVIHPDDLYLVLPANAQGFVEDKPIEYRIIWPDKSIRYIWAKAGETVLDDAGHPIFLTGIAQDITVRKQAEEALAASRANLHALIENTDDLVASRDLEGKLILFDRSFAQIVRRLFGVEAHPGLRTLDYLPAEARRHWEQLLQKVAGGEPHREEFSWDFGDEVRHYELSFHPIRAGAEVIGSTEYTRDITARKQAEAELKAAHLKLDALWNIAALTGTDFQGICDHVLVTLVRMTESGYGFFGFVDETESVMTIHAWSGEAMKDCGLVNQPQHFPIDEAGVWGEAVRRRQPLILNDYAAAHAAKKGYPVGHVALTRLLVVPVFQAGHIVSVAAVANRAGAYGETDVNQIRAFMEGIQAIIARQQAEDALRQLNAELEQRVAARTAELQQANAELLYASRLKDEFLANMSHELRTPLTAILGLAEALQLNVYQPLTDKQAQAIQIIHQSGQHLLALITDILDLSRIEAGKMELELAPTPVADICQASLQFFKSAVEKKHLRLTFVDAPQVRLLHADARRLKQMLMNLLSNAIKFTPDGGQVELRVTGDPARSEVHFSVSDTGIGIPTEKQALLFQSFVQVDGSLSRSYEGTGLGLALTRRLAEMHGGRVTVESAGTDLGSRFIVSLPWQPAAPPPVVLPDKEAPACLRLTLPSGQPPLILLADDNEVSRMVVSDFLQSLSARVVTASDGAEALIRALATSPDLILMDIQMPGLNGLEAIRRLRAAPATAQTPIIALTALVMPGDRERCLAAGANDYLSKPVSLDELTRASTQHLGLKEV